MPTTIGTATKVALEESSFTLSVSFTDDDGNAVTPNAGLNWTLTDRTGKTVINSRETVIITPASTVYITLSGKDLSLLSTEKAKHLSRILTIQGTYDSSLGVGLSIVDECHFTVENLVYITREQRALLGI
jgi:hypothetical protein